MKNQTYRMTMLFDFYGELLTDRQKEFFDLYYNEDPEVISVAGGKNRIVYRLDSLKTSLKAVYRKCCTATDAGVYAAMVTGDRSDMDSTISELFSAAGIGVIFIHIRPKITVQRALGLFIGRLVEITGIRFAQQHNLKCVDHR